MVTGYRGAILGRAQREGHCKEVIAERYLNGVKE